MRSVIDHFKGSRDFPRLRIGIFPRALKVFAYTILKITLFIVSLNWRISVGIGRPPGKMDPVNFVLRPFTKQELEEVC